MHGALVTGGSGFVGRHLCRYLEAPNVLTRSPESAPRDLAHAACFRWSPEQELPPSEALANRRVVFHLAGEPVAEGRWTARKMSRIRSSRVRGTRRLVEGLATMDQPPEVLVSASAVGYYGSCGDRELTEESERAEGFLAEVCREWEHEALRAQALGMRVVTVRIGLVLGKGGALGRLIPLFKMGGGGRLGSGRHWMAWIHVEDLARLLVFAAECDGLSGPVNGVSPGPVRNREFTSALAQAVRRPALLPAPAWGLRLGLGGFAEVLLASQRVLPKAALQAGFEFRHPSIGPALRTLV